MGFYGNIRLFLIPLVVVIICCMKKHVLSQGVKFDENYVVTYGQDHFLKLEGGMEVQLSLDKVSGTGFKSKLGYCSGNFHMKLKLPSKHTPGIVTTFYLHSSPDKNMGHHDELDFEFLGNDGPVYNLQTNVFANDNGGREQRLRLWFDPTLTFHDYEILWNSHQIVFFIDGIPIRVHKNYESIGGRYPSQAMYVMGSIWNGDDWASGGRKVIWSQAPFQANYKGFEILGCPFGRQCDSTNFSWNRTDTWQLNLEQQKAYENVKRKYVYYDYCSNPRLHLQFKECQLK